MGRVIGLTIIAVVLLGGGAWFMFVLGSMFHEDMVQKQGMAGLKGAALNNAAARIMERLGVASTLDDVEIINSKNQAAIKEWLESYNKLERVK